MNKRTLSIILSCFLLTNNFLDAKPRKNLLGQTQQEKDWDQDPELETESDEIANDYEETEEVSETEFSQLQRRAFITGTAVLMIAIGIAGLYNKYLNL